MEDMQNQEVQARTTQEDATALQYATMAKEDMEKAFQAIGQELKSRKKTFVQKVEEKLKAVKDKYGATISTAARTLEIAAVLYIALRIAGWF